MYKSVIASLLLVTALLFAVGCSQNEESPLVGPVMDFGTDKAMDQTVSAITLCLDVSDHVSDADLQSAVEDLMAALANPDLVPRDGRVAVGGLVYGADTAFFLDGMVPVTPTNLVYIIYPALSALAADRLVPTDGVDLAGALTASCELMKGDAAPDKHILMIGSGVDQEGIPVAEAYVKVMAADIMTSGLTYTGLSTHRTQMEGCVAGTGGYFHAANKDLHVAVATALNYMLHVDLAATPDKASVLTGKDHTVTARVFRGGDPDAFPLAGQEVTFTVYDGPNLGATAVVLTDDQGQATFTYAGSGELGTDSIAAHARHPKTGESIYKLISAAWMNSAPVLETQYVPMFVNQDNHKYITITPDMVIERAEDVYGNPVDPARVVVVSVSSDEPEDTTGDGSTLDDILVECPNKVMLRTERQGGEQGRIYTIVYRLTDDNGTTAEDKMHIVVVKDSSQKPSVYNRDMGYTIYPECGSKEYENQF